MKTQQDKIDEILNEADEYFKNANYHQLVGAAEQIFNSIKKYIEPKNQLKAAKKLVEALNSCI